MPETSCRARRRPRLGGRLESNRGGPVSAPAYIRQSRALIITRLEEEAARPRRGWIARSRSSSRRITRPSSARGRRSTLWCSDSTGSTGFSSTWSRRIRRWSISRADLPTAIKVFSGLISPARARPSRTVIVGPICEASLAFGKNKMTRLRTELRPKRLRVKTTLVKGNPSGASKDPQQSWPRGQGQQSNSPQGSGKSGQYSQGQQPGSGPETSPGNMTKDNRPAQSRARRSPETLSKDNRPARMPSSQ